MLIVFILWPKGDCSFRFDPEELLATYVDREAPASLTEMHRTLAILIKQDMACNWRIIQPMRVALQLALTFLTPKSWSGFSQSPDCDHGI